MRLACKTLLCCLAIMLGLISAAQAEVLKIVTTTTDLADAVRAVGGDRVSVQAISKGYQNPHQVETKPSYLKALQNADGFIQTGLSLEIAWAPSLLRGARNLKIMPGKPGFFDASAGINVLQKPKGAVDRTMGDVHPEGNPHYTLSPTNMKIVARNITSFLKRLDPAGAAQYDKGYAAYWHQLDAADKRWHAKLDGLSNRTIVTYHNTWPYFAKHFKINVVGHLEPQAGISPSAKHLNDLVTIMKQNNCRVIVMEPWHTGNIAKNVGEKAGAQVLRLPILPDGVPNTPTYIQMMDYIVDNLAKALQ